MKKIIIFLLILIILAVGAVALFILTFNAERYRPLIESKLSEAAGNPVTVGKIDLTWQNGIALNLQDLSINGEGASPEPLLKLAAIKAVVDPFQLLKGSLQVGSLVLQEPRIHLIKTPTGDFVISGVRLGNKKSSGGGGALSFLVNSLEVDGGEIRLSDHNQQVPVDINIRKLDLSVKDVSLAGPLRFKAEAAVFGDTQNIKAKGELLIPFAGRKGALENFEAEADLSDFDAGTLMVFLPQLREAGIQKEGLSGKISAQITRFEFSERWSDSFEGKLKLRNGGLTIFPTPGKLESANLETQMSSGHLDISSFSANVAGGHAEGQASVSRLALVPEINFNLTAQSLDLSQLIPSQAEGEPYLSGRLSLGFKGQAVGKTSPQISSSLAGSGHLNLQNGVLVNMNLLREVFDKISLVPGLAKKLKEHLPESYLAKFEERDTVLGPIDLPFTAQNGFIYFEGLQLATDSFQFAGAGSVRTDGAMSVQGNLRIDPDLSGAIIHSVNELQNLADAQGVLEIPVKIQTIQGRLSIIPDLQYIASRIAVTKAEEWIGGLLGGKKSQQPTTETQTQADTTQTPSNQDPNSSNTSQSQNSGSLENLLGGFLQNALQKKSQ